MPDVLVDTVLRLASVRQKGKNELTERALTEFQGKEHKNYGGDPFGPLLDMVRDRDGAHWEVTLLDKADELRSRSSSALSNNVTSRYAALCAEQAQARTEEERRSKRDSTAGIVHGNCPRTTADDQFLLPLPADNFEMSQDELDAYITLIAGSPYGDTLLFDWLLYVGRGTGWQRT